MSTDPNSHGQKNTLTSSVKSSDVMRVYTDAVEKAKEDSERLLQKTKAGKAQLDEAQQHVNEMKRSVNSRCNAVVQEIKAISQRYVTAIQEREKFLLKRLESIHEVKISTLERQSQRLSACSKQLHMVSEQLTTCTGNGVKLSSTICSGGVSQLLLRVISSS